MKMDLTAFDSNHYAFCSEHFIHNLLSIQKVSVEMIKRGEAGDYLLLLDLVYVVSCL